MNNMLEQSACPFDPTILQYLNSWMIPTMDLYTYTVTYMYMRGGGIIMFDRITRKKEKTQGNTNNTHIYSYGDCRLMS